MVLLLRLLLRVEQLLAAGLVVRVWDPNDQVLASADEHAVDVAELDGSYSGRMEVEQADLVACLDVPHHDLLFSRLATRDQIPRIRTEASFKN